jgi:hypothetical protein
MPYRIFGDAVGEAPRAREHYDDSERVTGRDPKRVEPKRQEFDERGRHGDKFVILLVRKISLTPGATGEGGLA